MAASDWQPSWVAVSSEEKKWTRVVVDHFASWDKSDVLLFPVASIRSKY